MWGRVLPAAIVAYALGQASALAQQAPPPIEAFGRLPAAASAAISPDGTQVVFAAALEGPLDIAVIDLATRQMSYRRGLGAETQLRSVGWADDGRVSFVVSRTFTRDQTPIIGELVRDRRLNFYRSGVLDLASGNAALLIAEGFTGWASSGNRLIAPIEGDPGFGRLLGPTIAGDRVRIGLYRVDFSNDRVAPLPLRGMTSDTQDILLDERGAPLARIDSDYSTNHWSISVSDGDSWRQILDGVSSTGEPPDLEGLLPDGRFAMLDLDDQNELVVLYAVDRATGAKEVLFRRSGYDLSDAILDPWTRRVVGVRWTEEDRHQHFFEPALQAVYERLQAIADNGNVQIRSWSRDRSRVLIYIEHGFDGGGYYVFTPAANELMPLLKRYPELQGAALGDRQSITFPARDGTRIPAYLSLPPNVEPRNLPLVVLVHGGPHGVRDDMDFDFWAAFLASRGYAVLQANYRGSGGYGAHWEQAGYRQWGSGRMQTDVEDGAAGLVRAGIADAHRICIVGASYGGYAALAGAALTPDRYRCAVSVAGVSDLVDMLQTGRYASGAHSESSDFWRMSIGDLNSDRDAIRAISPVNLADRVHIPILLMHGTDDTVVPISQSQRMYDRLRAAGKDVRFVQLQGDDHWLSDANTRIQMLRELETFLATNLAPQTH